jgi:ELWxxDGT repeat protein
MVTSLGTVAHAGTPTGNSNPQDLTALGGSLFFSAKDGEGDRELWTSNGTPAGTHLVKDIDPAGKSRPWDLTAMDGMLYFTAQLGDVRGLWKSDGTEQGTDAVATIPGVDPYVTTLTAVGDTLFFLVYQRDTDDHELWKTDGSQSGTQLVQPLPSGQYDDFEAVGSTLYFLRSIHDSQSSEDSITQLWRSDGTAAGTVFVEAFPNAPFAQLARVGTRLFLLKGVGTTGHFPPPAAFWKSNGTSAGTRLVRDLVPEQTDYAYDIVDAQGIAYLHASNGLWKSDGSHAGTVRLSDVDVSYQHRKMHVGGNVFFVVRTGQLTTELWKSNGTNGGTRHVSDAAPFRCLTEPFEPCDAGYHFWREAGLAGVYYFASDAGTKGIELWRSDGTSAGTRRLKDIRLGSQGSEPSELTKAGSKLYFIANDGTHGRELWVSDGTRGGTRMVLDINDS